MIDIRLNNSTIKIIILAIQIAIIGILAMDYLGLESQLLRLLRIMISFIYLTFLPGLVTIKLLDLNSLNDSEKLIYTVGLSILILMFIGLLLNIFCPIIQIPHPLNINNLLIILSIYVIFCFYFAFIKKIGEINFKISLNKIKLNLILYLGLVFFISVLGSLIMNIYNQNIILMLSIILIALVPILIAFDKISKDLYPYTIFIVGISLLYQTTLVSRNLWGWDIQAELYFASLTAQNLFWNISIDHISNNTLSVTILPAIYSIFLDINVKWIFKIIFPILFSLVPVGLYNLFKTQLNEKNAFLSCFFFMSIFVFYVDMVQLGKQQIAELFLVLLMLLIINKTLNKLTKSILLIVFSIGIVFSHYGVSYLYMLIIISFVSIHLLVNKIKLVKINNIFGVYLKKIHENFNFNSILSYNYLIFFIVVVSIWYMSFPGYNSFELFINLGNNIFINILDLANPITSDGAATIIYQTSFTRNIIKYTNILGQLFIAIGILILFLYKLKRNKNCIDRDYFLLALVTFTIPLFGIILPFFGGAWNVSRLYHLTLFILAPFCFIGFLYFLKYFFNLFGFNKTKESLKIKIFTIFLLALFLSNVGFITELTDEDSFSFALSQSDNPVFTNQEIIGAEWLKNYMDNRNKIYTDENSITPFHSLGIFNSYLITNNSKPLNSYIFLDSEDLANKELYLSKKTAVNYEPIYLNLDQYLVNSNLIYSSGIKEIYY